MNKRDAILEPLLEPLTKRQREAMEAICRTVPDELIQDAFDVFLDRVIRKSANLELNKE